MPEWLLPVVAISLSVASLIATIVFASAAKKDADKAQETLSAVNGAVQTWQSQIMDSTVKMLNANPQLIEGQAVLAKVEAAKGLIEGAKTAMEETARSPHAGASGATQTENLALIMENVGKILDSMVPD